MRGNGPHDRGSGLRAAGAGIVVAALTAALVACGGGSSQVDNEAAGTYRVKVVSAKLPTRQRLAQNAQLRIAVRNESRRTIPSLVVNFHLTGKSGRPSQLAFAVRDPQPGLSQPDRPVWILNAGYPRLAGEDRAAGAETADARAFSFGPLKPGATRTAVWKLTAVRTGSYELGYRVDAGLSPDTKAVDAAGRPVTGSFGVSISGVPPATTVNSKGQVVPIQRNGGQ